MKNIPINLTRNVNREMILTAEINVSGMQITVEHKSNRMCNALLQRKEISAEA